MIHISNNGKPFCGPPIDKDDEIREPGQWINDAVNWDDLCLICTDRWYKAGAVMTDKTPVTLPF